LITFSGTRAKPAKIEQSHVRIQAEQRTYSLQTSRSHGKEVIGSGGTRMSKLREARARACVQVGGGECAWRHRQGPCEAWIATICCTGEVEDWSTEDIDVAASID
jgi:hypothetical protein